MASTDERDHSALHDVRWQGMVRIGVVHLVRAANGIEPLRAFLDSYQRNRGGIDHELVVVLKGFSDRRGRVDNGKFGEYQTLLDAFPHQRLFVPDAGYDIRPYFVAAKSFGYEFFCFLNSFSRPLDEDWLEKMYRHASKENVGLVGATGSYQSLYSFHEQQTAASKADQRANQSDLSLKRLRSAVWSSIGAFRLKRYFDPFPNCHVRTNAFMVARATLNAVDSSAIGSKMDAYRFESGKSSMTKQIIAMGKSVLVVGRDGAAHMPAEWPRSNTFWSGKQENLLVADKQTDLYANADSAMQQRYEAFAWSEPMAGAGRSRAACAGTEKR